MVHYLVTLLEMFPVNCESTRWFFFFSGIMCQIYMFTLQNTESRWFFLVDITGKWRSQELICQKSINYKTLTVLRLHIRAQAAQSQNELSGVAGF
jgi:hypothetical protein